VVNVDHSIPHLAQPILGIAQCVPLLAQTTLLLDQSFLGLVQSFLDTAQAVLLLAQSILDVAHATLGVAQTILEKVHRTFSVVYRKTTPFYSKRSLKPAFVARYDLDFLFQAFFLSLRTLALLVSNIGPHYVFILAEGVGSAEFGNMVLPIF